MAKRKASRKIPVKKNNIPLASSFKCLFCHHDKSVSVKMDKGTMFGHLTCKTCGQHYTTPINNLSAAVDVYFDWVDACEEIREKQPKRERPVRGISPLKHGAQGGANLKFTNGDDEDEDEDEDEYGDRSRPAAPGHTESELEESNSSDEGSGERRRTHGDEKGYEGRRQPMAPGHDEMDEDDYRSRKRRRG
ncbi:MAG: hypothetical protein TREMPRED_004856 [Tremellales sp. Tagirdzhanova-0007]|nr:MAG: hypothetical protein TREMPRED_004856 [Tremellales sp. Tagirdzhanova-0007]